MSGEAPGCHSEMAGAVASRALGNTPVMDIPSTPIRALYADWTQYRARLTGGIRGLTDAQLAISAGAGHAPIWALAAHCAGVRIYWLCGVLGEPGAGSTPFPDPWAETGWEDDLGHPRSADELVRALDSTDAIIERILDTWIPGDLDTRFERRYRDTVQVHTRRSVLLRLLSHDAFHAGEISQLLGLHGLPAIDLWAQRPST
jgi:DinB superfamily